MKRNCDPIKHHFVPSFYLGGWAENGTLEYWRRHGSKVKCKTKSPSASGYEKNLYQSKVLPPDQSQFMETQIWQRIDNDASVALRALLSGREPLPDDLRASWSVFVESLYRRHPDVAKPFAARVDIPILKGRPNLDSYYAALAISGAQAAAEIAKGKKLLAGIVEAIHLASKSKPRLSSLHWSIFDFSSSNNDLITCDFPLITVFHPFDRRHIILPISRNKAFAAAFTSDALFDLASKDKGIFANEINNIIVAQARRCIFTADRKHKHLIEDRMGEATYSTPLIDFVEHTFWNFFGQPAAAFQALEFINGT